MSKTFQEIEISNGSWIKEQSDPINILNEDKFIEFSEDTFRLFDAMIFISYNASPLMHALESLKQSLNYKDYWEKSIDYIISEINLKEYNQKSKEGIENFVLLWNIIANKNFSSNEIRNQLIVETINILDNFCRNNLWSYNIYSEEKLPDDNLKQITLDIERNSILMENPIKENILENKISGEINKIGIKSIYYTNILNENLLDKSSLSNIWIGNSFNIKSFCVSQNKHSFGTTINNNKFYNSLLHIKNLKLNYKDWFKRELRNWLKANLIFNKKSDNIIVNSSNNITYEIFELYKVITKLDISHKNTNKFESIFKTDLLDIYKNVWENKSKIYILKIIFN